MRKISQLSGAFLVVFLLSACGGSDSAAVSSERAAVVPASADAVAGMDADNNGVRDDIDELVAGFPLTDAPKNATLQLAGAVQTAITTSSDDEAASRNAQEVLRAQTCMASLMPDFATYVDTIHAQTFNTELRHQAWLDFQEKTGRQEFPVPQGVICN